MVNKDNYLTEAANGPNIEKECLKKCWASFSIGETIKQVV